MEEINLSKYFQGINGTAVFYNPSVSKYKIYNIPLSHIQSSPCSTFKVMSAYIALSENLFTQNNSIIEWNGKNYENPVWNKNMDLQEAFKTSCVWYFRDLIDKIPQKTIKSYLQKHNYGNQTASQRILSDLSKIHISELVLTIQEEMRKILKNYVFKYNNYQYRLEIYTKAEEVMKQIFSNGGVYWWQNVIDTTNNTLEVINNSMGILDTHIIATKGGEKWVHRTYLETGANISGFETMM